MTNRTDNKSTMLRNLSVGIIAAAFAFSACSKKDDGKDKPTTKAPAKSAKTAKTSKATTKAPPTGNDIAGVMKAYEAIRAALADDKADVAAHAKALADAAKSAKVGDAGKPALASLATAAQSLASADKADIAAVRKSYGEVSKAAVALMSALPAEAKKYHVFECPMAKGYKRWIQSDKELKNPYMGKKMLACGSEVAFGGGAMKGGEHKGHKGMKH